LEVLLGFTVAAAYLIEIAQVGEIHRYAAAVVAGEFGLDGYDSPIQLLRSIIATEIVVKPRQLVQRRQEQIVARLHLLADGKGSLIGLLGARKLTEGPIEH